MIGRSIFWKTDQSLLVHQASTSRGKENAYLADDNFKSTKPLGEKKYRKFERIDKVNYIFRPFANEFRPAASSNRVYLGQSQENEIKVFDGKGDFLGKYHIPVKRRKVPDEEKDIYKNAYASQPATLEFGEAPYVDRIIAFEDQVVVIQDGKGQVFDLNFKKLGDLDAYLGSTGDLIAFRAVGKRLISISYGEEEVHLIQSFKVVPKKTK